jgi:TolA-binding protein
MRKILPFAVAGVLAVSSVLRADTLWISSGGGNPVEYPNIRVLGVENGQITYQTTSGDKRSRPFDAVVRMKLDDEPNLTVAEEAYAKANWDGAVDGYQRVMRATSKAWLRDWSAVRVIEAANKSGRFDAAIAAFVLLAERDPSTATRMRPTLPKKGSAMLDLGVQELNKALGNQRLSKDSKQALRGLLLEIYRVQENAEGAAKVVKDMEAEGAGDVGSGGDANIEQLATLRLSQAQLALDTKKYDQAIELIEKNLELFRLPRQQADALWVLAEAKYAKIGEYDKHALQDAALAYMRVVTYFQNQPGAPHVAEALFKTGQILERLSEPREAAICYEDVIQQFGNSAVAADAKAALQKLKGEPEKPQS